MDRIIKTELNRILDDKTSGSTELLEKLNEFFQNHHTEIPDFALFITALENHFAQFEIICKYLIGLKKASSNPVLLNRFIIDHSKSSKNITDEIFKTSLPFLADKKSILTISNSKTVLEILLRLITTRKLLITICESRPKLEGRVLAKLIAKTDVKVQFITEAQAAFYVSKCDCVITGTDSILKNGDVVNKTGSYSLAILAKHFKKPLYVVAAKNKYSKTNSFLQFEEKPDEIWNVKMGKVAINNLYFEKIPARLITKIITN